MNILLIYPAKSGKNGKPVKYKKAFLPPLSLAILAGLTPAEHNLKIINDIAEEIDFSANYDLVGITAMTAQAPRAYRIADRFRKSGAKVIIGGVHAAFLPDEAQKHADSVIIGEVENIWEQILLDFKHNRYQERYHDAAFPDLQKLTIPKWDNFNLKVYPKRWGHRFPMMPIYTTRGCPHGCSFCSVSKYFGRTYRVKPISHVIRELESTQADEYFFVDDNIACNYDYSRELFQALSKRKVYWFSQVSANIVETPELIDLAAASGCMGMFVGIETINNENLKSVNKSLNKIEQYEELFARFRKAGIPPFVSMILGLDDDTPELFKQTGEFLMKNKVANSSFALLTPLPGTDLYNEMEKSGRMLHHNWSLYDLNNVVYRPKKMTVEELYTYGWQTFQEFYSIKNIAVRIFFNVMVSPNPFKRFWGDLFYQSFFRRAVYSFEHPFSGGVGKLNPNNSGIINKQSLSY